MSRSKDEERQKLAQQIAEWNDNRLDLFELSPPNENLEFFGVMRFFFQDPSAKVSTKCIRVASDATSKDVVETLIEKFRPDMRMLTTPHYCLYEVHANGEERRLSELERPLFVQLNWGKDDREGRFLLRNEDHNKNIPIHADHLGGTAQEGPTFKRKLSKREKKELKKKEKENKLKGKENEKPNESVAEKLYTDMPDTSFTRTISNPEVVMRRRRQQKLEKKLQEIRSKDDQGGTLKIYGESICPDVPYKTLLLSSQDTAEYVVQETLNKYGLEKEDPVDYCLIQVLLPPGAPEFAGMSPNQQMYILDEEDCPLAILMQHPPSKGLIPPEPGWTIMFQLKKRTADMPRSRKRKKPRMDKKQEFDPRDPRAIPLEKQPFLCEINPDGSEPKKALRHILPLDLMEVGSDKTMTMGPHFLKLIGPDIYPRHCVIAHSEGIVTITPAKPETETYINQRRITETTMLHHGMVVRFGRMHLFRFIDPMAEEKMKQPPVGQDTLQRAGAPPGSRDPDFETTFDVDGHIETKGSPGEKGGSGGVFDDLLPASIEYREDGEDALLSLLIPQVNGAIVQFKLAPTYSLYMTLRCKLRRPHGGNPAENMHRINRLVEKIADFMHQTIQEHRESAGALSFWMANSSELLHFIKADRDLSVLTPDAQDILAESVQVAFQYLVSCLQRELQAVMTAFLDESTEDLSEEEVTPNAHPHGKPNIGDVLSVLSSAMSLLRRCRVNAALTIQLFSQLFHFVNMWLFNRLVTEPHLRLCTRGWGHRLKRRLGRIEIWAEKQGLELAADCHLSRIIQAAHLLEAPKGSPDDILSISSTCFKLNSLQLRALLQNYIPSAGEPHIQPELINRVVSVAQNTADELTRSDGLDVRLEEEPDLQLPFLLPEDGYSCDIVKGVPNGLAEFLEPIMHTGVCQLSVNQNSKGMWTVYMGPTQADPENLRAGGQQPEVMPASQQGPPPGMPKEPEVLFVAFNKVNGSMGLSIVAAKGEGQKERGIYIKSVVPGGAAAQDGRLQAGDQLMEVDGKNLIGLTQEKAAEHMTKTGQRVQLKVAKQGAIYHGLATMLSQPSPVMQRASPSGRPGSMGQSPVPMKPRPKSEDVSRFNGPNDSGPQTPQHPGIDQGGFVGTPGQKPLHMQHGARSSPALAAAKPHDQQPHIGPGDGYDPYRQGPYDPQDPRSKSVSNLMRPPEVPHDGRQNQSMGTLPRMHQGQPGMPPHHGGSQQMGQHPHQMAGPGPGPGPQDMNINRPLSQPELGPGHDYENYPGPQPGRQVDPRQVDYVNQRDLKAQQGSQSMYNLRDDPNAPRPDDMNYSRVREWQQRNEMANRTEEQWGSPSGAPGQFNSLPRDPRQQGVRMQQPPPQQLQQAGGRPMEAQHRPHDPRGPPFQQQQQNYPPNSQQQLFPQGAAQPGQNFNQQQQGRRPPGNQYPGGPQQHSEHATYQNVQFPNQRPDVQQQQQQQRDFPDRRTVSPDLPPPPDVPPELPPPPEDVRNTSNEDLPPPPVQNQYDPRDPRSQTSGGPGGPQHDPRHLGPGQKVPPPNFQGNQPPQNYHNYQNLPPASSSMPPFNGVNDNRGQYAQSPSSNNQYPYQPRPAPAGAQQQDMQSPQPKINSLGGAPTPPRQQPPKSVGGPPRQQPPQSVGGPVKKPQGGPIQKQPIGARAPPIAAKPKINLAAEIKKSLASPWEREEKENENKRKEEEMRLNRDIEIRDLESRNYLLPEEHERLKRLRVDQEFDKRALEASERTDDDDDLDEKPAARIRMIRQMQDDLERKRQQSADDKKKQVHESSISDMENKERTERRIQQFEADREEQRHRQLRQQEMRAKETEDILKKKRVLRDLQRQEFEEQKRQQREEERMEEKQKEELRLKRKMEKEQMREMQEARERDSRGGMRDNQVRQEFERMHVSDDRPPSSNANAYQQQQPAGVAPSNKFAPPPPERTSSSYDVVYRAGSNSNLPASMYNETSQQQPRGVSNSVRPNDIGGSTKKSVSFDSNLATEIHVFRNTKESTSSENSYINYHPSMQSPVENSNQQPSYPYRGGSTSSSEPQTPQYQPNPNAAGGPNPPPPLPHTAPPPNAHYQNQGPPSSQPYINHPPHSGANPLYQPSSQPGPQYHPSGGPQYQQPPSSQYQQQPAPGTTPGGTNYPSVPYQNGQSNHPNNQYQDGMGSSQYGGPPPPNHSQQYQGYNGPTNAGSPYTPQQQGDPKYEQQQQRTPVNSNPTLIVGDITPGVVGANEIYRDPRDRMLASKQTNSKNKKAENMSFRDKMKMFASEIGENTPPDKNRSSRVQQQIDAQLTSP